ncbi:DUF5956 family protein [Micromonospora mirobrigensis]|uniref:Uncharacterized protein n=1 Tax=Micromonospora mirobrigensis TaxID=262898 RepID=A0A1C4W635_9ACTN|nr:DUF5956 family protein [Micromonospora mirobrigensis]SCE91680.1 hypothetical protein GA0070564_10234 [Micromonospora mirobrigensis]
MGGQLGAGPGGWIDVPLSAEAPPAATGEYVELPASGWGALVGWAAGPAKLVRVPERPEAHTTVMTTSGPAGDRHRRRPRTEAEQVELDGDIDIYLRDGGIPARPAGYRWFLRLPAGYHEDEFWSELHEALNHAHPAATHPACIARQVGSILREIFEGAGR